MSLTPLIPLIHYEVMLQEIREATNKAWVLGNDCFKQQVEAMTIRQASPKSRGGDRKSKGFRHGKQINQSDPIDYSVSSE